MEEPAHPIPFAYPEAGKEVHSIAAPLLTAAALSLAGVVAAATDAFLLPGPALLLLVAASLLLVAAIQLHYYSRQFLYTRAEMDDWLSADFPKEQKAAYQEHFKHQKEDFRSWRRFHGHAVHCFNAGTLFLGIGVAAALLPPLYQTQAIWRMVAAGMVLAAVVADMAWTLRMYRNRGKLENKRLDALGKLYQEMPVSNKEDP